MMIIKFSWRKINNKFSWNAYKVVEYFYAKRGIKSQFYIAQKHKSVLSEAAKAWPRGDCYILNLDEALKQATDPNYLYYYLELASKRNLFDYKARGITYLPIQFVPEYLMGLVNTNPMLEVKDEKLYFKYEQR